MKTLRFSLTLVSGMLLAGGYASSQVAFFQGRAAEHAQQMDSTLIRVLAAVLLGAAVIFSILPKEKDAQ